MLTAVVLVVVLFVGLLGMKATRDLQLCALCGAVSGTWITLLALYHGGYYANETVIALLIGQSIVGGYYWLYRRAPGRFAVFTLPFILTATVLGYTVLVPTQVLSDWWTVGVLTGLLASCWLIAGLLYAYRHHSRFETVFDEVIDCCRNW